MRRLAMVGLGWCLLGAACTRTKERECHLLIHIINSSGDEVAAATKKVGAAALEPGAITNFSASIEKARGDLAAVAFDDKELRGLAKQYDDMLTSASKETRAMLTAAQANDLPALEKAITRASQLTVSHTLLANRINDYCKAQ